MRLVFDADAWDSTISFAAGIPVTLGGTLELTLADGVSPASQAGRTFDLFDWTGVNPTAAFAVASPYPWDLTQLYTTGEVTLLSLLGPGDANGDNQVDRADAAVLARNFGLAEMADWSDGDFDGNRRVDLLDMAILQSHFGPGAIAPSAAAVPEPSTLALAAAGIVGLIALRRRRRKNREPQPK